MKLPLLPKQKFTWRYFSIGATVGLLALIVLNRDLIPKNTVVHDIREATISAVQEASSSAFVKATPIPYNFEEHFIETCLEASGGNVAYCECSKEKVQEVDPLWDDGRGDAIYNETKQYLEVLCMIDG